VFNLVFYLNLVFGFANFKDLNDQLYYWVVYVVAWLLRYLSKY